MPATILQHRLFDGDAATSWTDLSATASEWNGSNHSSQSSNTTKTKPYAGSSAALPPRKSIVVPNPDPDHPRKSVVAYWDGQGYVVSLENTTETDTETESDGAVLPRFVPSDTSSEDYTTTDDDDDFASDAESFCGDDPDENSSNSDSSIDEEKKKYEYGDARPSLSSSTNNNNNNNNNNKDSTDIQPGTANVKTNPFATLPVSSMCAPSPYYRRASVQRRNSTSNTSLRHTVHGSGSNWTNNNYYNGHGSTGRRYRTEGHSHRSADRYHNNNTNTSHRQHHPPLFPPRPHHRYHPNNNGSALSRRSAPRRRSNEEHYSQYAASSAPQRRRSSMGPCAAVPTPALAVARDDGAPTPPATGPPPGFSLPAAAEEEEVVRDPWDCLDLQMLHALDHEGGSSGPAEHQRRHRPTPATAAVGTATASSDSNTDTTTNDACLLRGLNWEMEPSYLYEVATLSPLDSTVLEHQLDAFLFGRHRRASM